LTYAGFVVNEADTCVYYRYGVDKGVILWMHLGTHESIMVVTCSMWSEVPWSIMVKQARGRLWGKTLN
jgi:hypothetical protein